MIRLKKPPSFFKNSDEYPREAVPRAREERRAQAMNGLVGSEREGLKQTFTKHSANTLIVNEYIHRYGGFDGFFRKSNVTLLTEATGKQ
ncbi:MAG: hypothetical protein HZB92_02505 [Euryarchaeota archaeon]|nr:hypothetical protein [Euryarchaeota archaeon]